MEKASWVYTDPPTTNGCWLKWDYVWLRLHCRSQNVFWLSLKIQEYWILFLQALTKQASQLLLSWALQQSNSVFQALPSFPPPKRRCFLLQKEMARNNFCSSFALWVCSARHFGKVLQMGLWFVVPELASALLGVVSQLLHMACVTETHWESEIK